MAFGTLFSIYTYVYLSDKKLWHLDGSLFQPAKASIFQRVVCELRYRNQYFLNFNATKLMLSFFMIFRIRPFSKITK